MALERVVKLELDADAYMRQLEELRQAQRDAAQAMKQVESATKSVERETKDAAKAIRQTSDETRRMADSFRHAEAEARSIGVSLRQLGGVAKAALTGFAIGFATEALGKVGEAARQAGEKVAEVDRIARNLDLPVEQVSKLANVFEVAGIQSDRLWDALKDLSARFEDARTGNKNFAALFTELGISLDRTLDPITLFNTALVRLGQASPTRRNFILDELLSDAGTEAQLLVTELPRLQKAIGDVGVVTQQVADAQRAAGEAGRLAGLQARDAWASLSPTLNEISANVSLFVAQMLRDALPAIRGLAAEIGLLKATADDSLNRVQARLDAIALERAKWDRASPLEQMTGIGADTRAGYLASLDAERDSLLREKARLQAQAAAGPEYAAAVQQVEALREQVALSQQQIQLAEQQGQTEAQINTLYQQQHEKTRELVAAQRELAAVMVEGAKGANGLLQALSAVAGLNFDSLAAAVSNIAGTAGNIAAVIPGLQGFSGVAKGVGQAAGIAGLEDSFEAKLRSFMAAGEAAGVKIGLNSGFRSNERQAELFAKAVAKYGSPEAARKWVAPPGRSMHNSGLAGDLSFGPGAQHWAHQNAAAFGLNFRMAHEPWHVEPTQRPAVTVNAQPAPVPSPAAVPTPRPSVPGVGGGMSGAAGAASDVAAAYRDAAAATSDWQALMQELQPGLVAINANLAEGKAQLASGKITQDAYNAGVQTYLDQTVQAASSTGEYNRELAELKAFLDAGAIAQGEFNKRAAEIKPQLQGVSAVGQQLRDTLGSGLGDTIGGSISAMINALASGEKPAKAFFKAMISGLANLASALANQLIQNWIKGLSFGGPAAPGGAPAAAPAGGGGGGFLSGIGSIFGSIFKGIGGLFGFARGGAFGAGTGLAHGVYTSPTFFNASASGFHAYARGGVGVMAERHAEAVMPLARGRGGKLGVLAQGADAPFTGVQILNQGPPMTARARIDPEQQRLIVEMTLRETERQIMQGATPISRAIEGSYVGVRRRGL